MVNIIDKKDEELLKRFLQDAGKSLMSFRYYDSRPYRIMENHEITSFLVNAKNENLVFGYGHIEKENGIIWLGIAVAEPYLGKGFGKKMLLHLLQHCSDNKLTPIHLTVDEANETAIRLYEKHGFREVKVLSNGVKLMRYE